MEPGFIGIVVAGGVVVAFVALLLIEHRLSRIQQRTQDLKVSVERMDKRLARFAELAEYWLELTKYDQKQKKAPQPDQEQTPVEGR